ncbi:hypothetical protein TSUD_125510 [Trifolium subterraneum]|uniref:Uncharacterized protein n=1 Tax=Trifolium subterraneum TaxID=3900 RepID=A0A2Z6MUA3_TRISU|nr:hypothetical protein TSUD_125510 [Trifolium subterraneum]
MPHFNHTPAPYNGPSSSDLLKRRNQYLPTFVGTYYTHPLNLVEGKMQYVYDENGRRYLDAFGGIATVSCGHCHPDVVDAIINQSRLLQHTTVLYLNHAVVDFAEALAAKMPGELKVVYFTNSGTEANELALMMARLYTGYHDIISIRNGYHGNATSTMGATAQFYHKFNVVQTGIHHVLNPDPYRGVFGLDGTKYANDVQDIINHGTCGHVAGFVAEAIQGIGNGAPIGAVVTTPEIAKVLKYAYYFSTFGGNPVCTAAGLAVLNVIEKDKLQQNAHVVGSYLKDRLNSLMEKHKNMGVLVGKGGFYGNVLRITPPLCFTKEDADFLVDVMDYTMSKM